MRAEEGEESIDQLADEAQRARAAVDGAADEHAGEVARPSSQPDLCAVEQDVHTPTDEALGGVPSAADD